MILTTTPSVEGRSIKEYLGVVTTVLPGEVPVGSPFNEMDVAIDGLRERAEKLHADAVVGICIAASGAGGGANNSGYPKKDWSEYFNIAIGTAVKLK